MSLAQIDSVAQSMLFDEHRAVGQMAPNQSLGSMQPFDLRRAPLVASDNPARMHKLDQQRHELPLPLGHRQGVELDRQIFAIAIDDQPAEPIGLAEYKPRAATGIGIAKRLPKTHR